MKILTRNFFLGVGEGTAITLLVPLGEYLFTGSNASDRFCLGDGVVELLFERPETVN